MNRHPNPASLGGTVIMVMAAFANAANAADCPSRKSAEATSVEIHHKAELKAEVEA